MATYFGHKPRWKQTNFGNASGPLRPPTPVEPRPKLPVNPGRRLTLPGPGPKAGGRYGVTLPFKYDPLKSGSEEMQRYNHYRKSLEYSKKGLPSPFKTMKGLLKRSTPWLRGLDLGFQLLDMWQTVQQEDPIKLSSGWSEHCRTGLQVFTDYRVLPSLAQSSCSQVNGTCGQTGQITSGSWGPGSVIDITGRVNCSNIYNAEMFSIAFGPGTGSGSSRRMTFARVIKFCQEIRCPGVGPDPGPIVWQPPVVVRTPRVDPPPSPQEQYQPRRATRRRRDTRQQAGPKGSIWVNPRPTPRTQTGPGSAPYWPPGNEVPNLPHVKERKWVLRDPRIADWYGKLTELKDGLGCYEMAIGIDRPEGGLHERIMKAAERTVELLDWQKLDRHTQRRTQWSDWGRRLQTFLECIAVENAKDEIIGRANKLANQITKNEYYRRPVGIGRGGFSVRMR